MWVVAFKKNYLEKFCSSTRPEFSNEKNVHLVISRNCGTTTSGFKEMQKLQQFHLRIYTCFLVASKTVIDVEIKLM
jgi:hypothetical protein